MAHLIARRAKYIREADRTYNIEVYPKLTYPELYILEGGYSAFFKTHPTRCFPQSYVEMGAKEHERACERGLSKIRQRSKIGRAATFAAFGRPAAPIAESPPAAERRRNEGRNVTW
jgi:M-phase inducer tyrosine phosphatase